MVWQGFRAKGEKMKSTAGKIAMMLLCAALLGGWSGCGKKKAETPKPAEGARFKSPEAFREYMRDKMVSPCDGLTFTLSDKYNPDCPARDKIMGAVDRMIRDGWPEKTVEETAMLFVHGEPIEVAEISGAGVCEVQDGTVRLDFFVMSQCPFGYRFISGALKDMTQQFEQALDWHVHFIVESDGGAFESMHGESEVREDKRQACVVREWGNEKWLRYAECYDREWQMCGRSAPDEAKRAECFELAGAGCANGVGIQKEYMDKCMAERAPGYLAEDEKATDEYEAYSSPTHVYNCSKKLSGAFPLVTFKPYVCDLFPAGKRPKTCPI